MSGQEWEEFTIHKIDIRGRIRKKTLAWASPRAQGSRQRHAITLLGRAWPRIMSMVRFLTPRPFFGSNRRLSSTSSQNGILRVPWPSIFNFLPKRSLNRRKPSRNDRGTTWGQLATPVTCSENVVRSRRGLRRSNRNRAKKRSRLGTRNSTDLNFRGFEPPGPIIAGLFCPKRPARTGSRARH